MREERNLRAAAPKYVFANIFLRSIPDLLFVSPVCAAAAISRLPFQFLLGLGVPFPRVKAPERKGGEIFFSAGPVGGTEETGVYHGDFQRKTFILPEV
jgi:hypothetical protein